MFGQVLQCGSCNAEFTAKRMPSAEERETRPSSSPDDDADRPRPRRSRIREEDDRGGRKSKGGGVKIVLMVLGGVALLGLLLCGCGGFFFYNSFLKVESFAESDWKDRSTPDGLITMKFPGPVKDESKPAAIGGTTQYSYSLPPPKDGTFMLMVLDMPFENDAIFDESYKSGLNGALKETPGAKVVRDGPVTVAGFKGKEAEITVGNASAIFRMLKVKAGSKTMYVMFVSGGRNISVADRDKFLASFKVKAGK